jgi:hypothetical protein
MGLENDHDIFERHIHGELDLSATGRRKAKRDRKKDQDAERGRTTTAFHGAIPTKTIRGDDNRSMDKYTEMSACCKSIFFRILEDMETNNRRGDERAMDSDSWVLEFPAAITVCDAEGTILEMNARARESFAAEGGAGLLGTNVLDCHPEPARSMLRSMLASGRRNVYTIRKSGIRKVIYQSPWYREGVYAGFVELSLPVPDEMPHFDRDATPSP